MYRWIFFIKFGKFGAIIFSNILCALRLLSLACSVPSPSPPPPGPRFVCFRVLGGVPQLGPFFLVLFLFCCSDWVGGPTFRFANSSFPLLRSAGECPVTFLVSVIALFSSRISVRFFLWVLSLCWLSSFGDTLFSYFLLVMHTRFLSGL